MSDIKKAMDLVSKYQDPDSPKMKNWPWRPLKDVQNDLGGMREIPPHVEDFGAYMDEMARKAATKGLEPRDLIKAYAITRSSIQRRSQTADKLRASGLYLPPSVTGSIRPEGAMSEWLKSPMGQRYLDAAEVGKVDQEAVDHAQKVMQPFGLKAESDALPWAAENLHDKHKIVSDMVKRAISDDSPVAEWREFGKKLRGIGTAKAGFVASMVGRGDQPTLDARQVVLQTGMPTSAAKSPMKRAGFDAVDRLAARQTALNPKMDPALEPFRQHLTHHAIWDKAGNEQTTHSDVIDAMRNAKDGGRIGKQGGGGMSDHDIIAHAIAALGIQGHDLPNIRPDYIKALQKVSTPFSRDPDLMFKRGGAVQPTDAQKAAGNYRKEHISFQGLPISIENRKGDTRSGTGPDGRKWSVKLPYDYGYIKRTEGADGDHVDVCIGPYGQSDHVFVVDQHDHRTGKFDEHKVLLGYRTKSEAEHAYVGGFSDGKGPLRMKNMVSMPMAQFKLWLKKCDTKKPMKSQQNIERALSLTSLYSLGHDRDAG